MHLAKVKRRGREQHYTQKLEEQIAWTAELQSIEVDERLFFELFTHKKNHKKIKKTSQK
jgi:hypothetical protein